MIGGLDNITFNGGDGDDTIISGIILTVITGNGNDIIKI